MKEFVVKINLKKMTGSPEMNLFRILKRLSSELSNLKENTLTKGDKKFIHDNNDNAIGSWEIK